MNDKQLMEQFQQLKRTIEDWEAQVISLGNQCAYTDRMMEEIFTEAKKLEQIYNDQFEKQTYYIAFEQQGYEQLIVKVEATCENEAFNIAQDAYLGDAIDRYIVEPKNLGRYDCAIIDSCGRELSYGECMLDDDDIEEEDN